MIPKAPFGKTGHQSTRTIFGGAALWRKEDVDAKRVLELLLSYGINHIDTAASYGDSELLIGEWMGHHRRDFFLATKTSARDYEGAKESVQRSLERLRVDHVDLIQLHCLVNPDEWEEAMGPRGALEALIEAKEAGLTRFIGVTGHGLNAPGMHLKSLDRYEFDSVLAPYDFPLMKIPDYARDFNRLYDECHRRGIALQTIKSIALRNWRSETRPYNTWYEPLSDQEDIDRAVHWVLSKPGVFLNTVGDVQLLPKVLDAASRYVSGGANEQIDEKMEEMAAKLKMEPIFPSPPGI